MSEARHFQTDPSPPRSELVKVGRVDKGKMEMKIGTWWKRKARVLASRGKPDAPTTTSSGLIDQTQNANCHLVGQEDSAGRYKELEAWVRERFPQAGRVDYRWSGQIYEPADYMAFIGVNSGSGRVYIVTGDSGNGLTHSVIASRLIPDLIEGKENPWNKLYSPKRFASILKFAPTIAANALAINKEYKRGF